MIVEDPARYFDNNEYVESLVLSVDYLPGARTLNFVVDHVDLPYVLSRARRDANHKPTRRFDRDLRRLGFASVENVQRKSPFRHGFLGFDEYDLSIRPNTGPSLVIMGIQATRAGDAFDARIDMSSNGVYAFRFGLLDIDQVLAKGIPQEDNDWVYYDVATKRQIDFWHPFNETPDNTETEPHG